MLLRIGNVVIQTTLSSQSAQEVAVLTTSGAAGAVEKSAGNEENFVKMTTFPFRLYRM